MYQIRMALRRLTQCFRGKAVGEDADADHAQAPPRYIPEERMRYGDLYSLLYAEYTRDLKVLANDSEYALLSREIVEEFLRSDHTDQRKYGRESLDCDDFALIVLGRFKLWFHERCPGMGSAFGFISGDLRPQRAPDQPRPHAMCCFIDHERTVWLLEPQNDAIMRLANTSTVHFILM